MNTPNAIRLIADNITQVPPDERSAWLRVLLAHTAAGIVVIEGDRAAAEACYKLSDAIVSRDKR